MKVSPQVRFLSRLISAMMLAAAVFLMPVLTAGVTPDFPSALSLRPVDVYAENQTEEIDETAVYQEQIIERANTLYYRLSANYDGFDGYISYTSRNLDSYESSLRQSRVYNDYHDEIISFTEAFADVAINFLQADAEGMLSTVSGMFVDEVTKGVLPKMTIDDFIYSQAWEGGDKVTISRLWDFKEIFEGNDYSFPTYDDAVDFIITVQSNKLGFAALSMGKSFYMDQLNESSWSMLGGIAKDMLVSQVLGFLPSYDWLGEWGGGYVYNTLLDGIETLATESNNPFISQWGEDIEKINAETEYLLHLDTSDPNLYPAHTVYLDPNGGSVSRTSVTVHETCPYGHLPMPYRFGYTFDGWYTAADGGTRCSSYTNYDLTEDQTLYAHWTHTTMASGTCGPELEWVLYGDGILEITGSGEMTSAPWHTYWTDCIAAVSLPDGLANIYDRAFESQSNLTALDIPDSVTRIGDFAFQNSGLTTLTLPSSLEYMGIYVLYGNEGVKELTLPAALQETGYGRYYVESVARSIPGSAAARQPGSTDNGDTRSTNRDTLAESTQAQPAMAVSATPAESQMYGGSLTGSAIERLIIQNGAPKVWKGVCDNALRLTSVSIPGSVTAIEEKAFAGCPSLQAISLPASVRIIGDYAFGMEFEIWEVWVSGTLPDLKGAESGLRSLKLPAGLQTLGQGVLMGNPYVTTLTIPASVTEACRVTWGSAVRSVTLQPGTTSVADSMFAGSTALEEIHLPDGLREIGSWAFSDCGLQSLPLPDSLEKMGEHILSDTAGVTSLTIPAGISDIHEEALQYSSVEQLTFQDGCIRIPNFAFRSVDTLRSVNLPASVEQIGDSAFEGCTSLSELQYRPEKLPVIGGGAFSNTALPLTSLLPSAFDMPWDPEESWYSLYPENYLICGTGNVWEIVDQAGGVQCQIEDENIVIFEYESLTPWNNGTTNVTMEIPGVLTTTFAITVRNLRILELPAGLKEIEEEAFAHLDADRIILPDGLEKIGAGAFRNCTSLRAVNIPDSVQEIGENAFEGCPQACLYCHSENAGYQYSQQNYGVSAMIERPAWAG